MRGALAAARRVVDVDGIDPNQPSPVSDEPRTTRGDTGAMTAVRRGIRELQDALTDVGVTSLATTEANVQAKVLAARNVVAALSSDERSGGRQQIHQHPLRCRTSRLPVRHSKSKSTGHGWSRAG